MFGELFTFAAKVTQGYGEKKLQRFTEKNGTCGEVLVSRIAMRIMVQETEISDGDLSYRLS